jgi:hypothetical protein
MKYKPKDDYIEKLNYEGIKIEQKNEDFCIINGNKVEGNACNVIVDNLKNKQ